MEFLKSDPVYRAMQINFHPNPRHRYTTLAMFDYAHSLSYVRSEHLEIPHPRLRERAFVLVPLLEIAPDATDPQDGHRYADDMNGLDGKKVTPFPEHES